MVNWLKAALFDARGRPRNWLWLFSLLLTGLGARLWLVHRFGSPLPIWDQWHEALGVYLPYSEGRLSPADLFAAHNEHRILWTRLYSLALLLVNHQWDNQLEMVANAIIHCATMAGLGWLMWRWLDKHYGTLLWLPLVLVLALPFGWENSLAGFQSQFYFLVLFSLLTLWLLGLSSPQSPGWWCGTAAAVMALFTVASGFLAAAAVFALVVLRVAKRPASWKQQAPTLALCAAVVLAGLLLKADVRHHYVFQAHSVTEFLIALGNNLAWPWIVVPPFAVLNLFPLAVLAWCYLGRTREDQPAEEMTLAIGIWAILQGAAAAYARGADGKPPGWRYMDSSSFILVANCFSLAVLLSRDWPVPTASGDGKSSVSKVQFLVAHPLFQGICSGRALLSAAFVLWGILCTAGLALLTSRAWQIDIPERQLYQRAQLRHARAFMASDNPRVFDGKPRSELTLYEGNPYAPHPPYEAEPLVQVLRDPRIRKILPACVRPPMEVRVNHATTRSFVTNGFQLAHREPPTEVSWGSRTLRAGTEPASFESLPIQPSQLPYLEIPVAGCLGNTNLWLELVELASGKRIPVKPCQPPGERWVNCYVRAPAGEFKIIARDASESEWFAFKAPRETGRLSYWAVEFLGTWKYLLRVGLALVLCHLLSKNRTA